MGQPCRQFSAGESQITGTQFADLTMRAQPRQRQRRIDPRRENDTQIWGALLDQAIDQLMNRGIADQMIVLEISVQSLLQKSAISLIKSTSTRSGATVEAVSALSNSARAALSGDSSPE